MTAPSTDEEDRSDMARLAGGQDAVLERLMGRYAERLFHYLLRLLQNETEASDLAQETFVRVYLNRKKFNPAKKFSTWLYAIGTNLARDLLRRRTRHPHVSLDNDERHDFRESLPDPKPKADELLEVAERANAVRLAVAVLPEELRAPLVLSVYEDKSHAEIGEILDCSAKAVEMRLYRGRQQLRGILERTLALH